MVDCHPFSWPRLHQTPLFGLGESKTWKYTFVCRSLLLSQAVGPSGLVLPALTTSNSWVFQAGIFPNPYLGRHHGGLKLRPSTCKPLAPEIQTFPKLVQNVSMGKLSLALKNSTWSVLNRKFIQLHATQVKKLCACVWALQTQQDSWIPAGMPAVSRCNPVSQYLFSLHIGASLTLGVPCRFAVRPVLNSFLLLHVSCSSLWPVVSSALATPVPLCLFFLPFFPSLFSASVISSHLRGRNYGIPRLAGSLLRNL